MYNEFIQIHLKTARVYLSMARSLNSEYYKLRALEQLSMARGLIKKEKESSLYIYLMTA